jgi:hypothetical protein
MTGHGEKSPPSGPRLASSTVAYWYLKPIEFLSTAHANNRTIENEHGHDIICAGATPGEGCLQDDTLANLYLNDMMASAQDVSLAIQ